MKKLVLLGALLCPISFCSAQTAPVAVQIAPVLATKSVFAAGFGEPQGLALRGDEIVVTDYKSGEVVRLDKDGKKLGVLATGLNGPSQIVVVPTYFDTRPNPTRYRDSFFVSERKANRIITFDKVGKVLAMGTEIPEPIGLVASPRSGLVVISHTTSKIYRWLNPIPSINGVPFISGLFRSRDLTIDPKGVWELIYAAPEADGERYGFRCLASDGDTLFFSDETDGAVWMLSPSGKIAKFASDLGDPSGLAFCGGALYVCDESNGGRLLKLDNQGKATVVANELGRPRGILFLDAQTVLLANRDGNIWKVVLPK